MCDLRIDGSPAKQKLARQASVARNFPLGGCCCARSPNESKCRPPGNAICFIIFELKKIGIYGGTFDPIHHAHLILAREALETHGLAEVIFVLAAHSPHKLNLSPTSAAIRW